MAIRFEAGSRRAALEGLSRILDAGALEDLFSGPDEEALFLYHLLNEVVRGRGSPYYWEICRTGRQRGVTPEFVVDRASVLLGSIEERRRTDIYRILGVPALASEDVIKQRWHELAKQLHPDVGGDPIHFRQVKEAFEILRDAGRRAEYERFWLRAVGPIARLGTDDEGVPSLPPASGLGERVTPERRVVIVARRAPATVAEPAIEPSSESVRGLRQAAESFGQAQAALAARVGGSAGFDGIRALVAQITGLLAPIDADDLARARAEIDDGIARLERVRDQLEAMSALKRRLSA